MKKPTYWPWTWPTPPTGGWTCSSLCCWGCPPRHWSQSSLLEHIQTYTRCSLFICIEYCLQDTCSLLSRQILVLICNINNTVSYDLYCSLHVWLTDTCWGQGYHWPSNAASPCGSISSLWRCLLWRSISPGQWSSRRMLACWGASGNWMRKNGHPKSLQLIKVFMFINNKYWR